MGNRTEITTVMMGGAIASLFLWLFGPLLVRWTGAPIPPEIGAATAIVFSCLLAFFLPAEVIQKIRRRTKAPKEPETPQS